MPSDLPTASDASEALRKGALTPRALVDACLARIDAREDKLRAWAAFDRDTVEAELERIAAIPGKKRGPLWGIPVGVKDIFDTADLPTEYGSPIYAGHRPVADAACVATLRAAGGIVLGKTVTTEFACYDPGPTRHPLDMARAPGGSSSGSAAAVADGMVPLALGTQTSASTIRPASYCGVVGFKPGRDRIALTGVKPLAPTLDTVGVFGRCVADVALLGGVLAKRGWLQKQMEDPPILSRLKGTIWDAALPEAAHAVEKALRRAQNEGARIGDAGSLPLFDRLGVTQARIMAYEAAREFAWETYAHPGRFSEKFQRLLTSGATIPPDGYDADLGLRARALDAIESVFDEADALILPSSVGEAPSFAEGTGDPALSRVLTLLGLPSVTIPCGTGPDGLPLGIQIAARPGEDETALAVASWFEALLAKP